MTDSRQLNNFVKHLIIAAKKLEEKPSIRPAERISAKPAEKPVERISINPFEKPAAKLPEREIGLKHFALPHHEKLRHKIGEMEQYIEKMDSRDLSMMGMMKDQIKSLEHELRITEAKRAEEIHLNSDRIGEIKTIITELREKITGMMDEKRAREERFAVLEHKIRREAKDSRISIAHIEEEITQLRAMEEKHEAGFFGKLKARLHKQPQLDKIVAPEEKELFSSENLPRRPLTRPMLRQRPVINHDMIIGEVEAKRGIPMLDKRPELFLPKFEKKPELFLPKPFEEELGELPPPPKPAEFMLKKMASRKEERKFMRTPPKTIEPDFMSMPAKQEETRPEAELPMPDINIPRKKGFSSKLKNFFRKSRK